MKLSNPLFNVSLAALVLLLLSQLGMANQPAKIKVTKSKDLYADGQLAHSRHLPLLIMFSMDGCTYCDLVREDFLEPMLLSGEYDDRVIIRIVKVDDFDTLRDFDGKPITADELALRYRAVVAPTVVFVDYRGHQLAERLIGISTPDFYGGDLDDAIALSLSRLRTVAVNRI